ncbi:MAG TPA: GNAT family protein [Hyphomonadaceae bacterium]|jgi:RimJ/RimL family protein N-acetyltransferase|nr:GNAT family protein [Hyphomonadaceae bacterium]HPN07096.1 GNAT family protein [Hyphomonadaceae bacterium]
MGDLSHWTPRPEPGGAVLTGARVRLEPMDWSVHGAGVFAAVGGEANAEIWEWMPVGPWAMPDALRDFLVTQHEKLRWRTLVIRNVRSEEILGMATYMNIREAHGSAEIGCVAFGPKLKRSSEATEALAMLAAHVFDLGYRRYEWKCNSLNFASKRAAERFGFTHEGQFRNDMVTKGKSRDTEWFSITDTEWPSVKAALGDWLAPSNFAADGAQIRTLESFRQAT